ncbi:hypothetical protein [Geodermatophilus sabuli]|uniref:Uncharacterized protein n=1 Tax=Geodermatophilus sabuli TaxID=1564158 RepID=A0A285E9M7_9ACTN|nr:hypothetical protein [Geodermatophilus sabuli]MBB3085009.1 hypothetical protein [Geodermatophilus sabuli]SNX95583.1 hypothetical protein SAMN06893097_102283 [Geodermatophilus sabuli]
MTTSPGERGAPRRDPETGGRPLADILREAGVESPARGRRRRDDEHDTGVRQRGSGGEPGADTGRVGERAPFGRRAVDRTGDLPRPSPTPTSDRRRARPEPSTAAIPGLRPSQKPGVPGATTSATGSLRAQRPADAGPSTGPIPVVRSDDDAPLVDEPLGPREGALAWLRFAGELVVALAAGVGIYFLFTVLWELLPYLAVVLAPLAVAALVAGVGAWRQRQDKEPAGFRLVGVLVFAATVLTIAPAAGLLAGT